MEVARFSQLPSLPPKTLAFIGPDVGTVRQRSGELHVFLRNLCSRPDIRNSEQFRNFIDFESVTSYAFIPHELVRGRTNVDARFGVVGIGSLNDSLITLHSDTTSLSRLGKVWNIVEADELSQLSIWRLSSPTSFNGMQSSVYPESIRLGDKVFTRNLPERVICAKMSNEGKLVLGMGNGLIVIFDSQNPQRAVHSIPAHGVSPVIGLDISPAGSVVSVGLDQGLRVSSIATGKIICGGKLSKRLETNEVLSCVSMHHPSSRAFVGTDKGRVFVFDIASGTPSHLHTLSMSSYPVRCISIRDDRMLIAFDCAINAYDLVPKGQEKSLTRQYQIQTFSSIPIHCCLNTTSQDVVVSGLGDGSVTVHYRAHLVYSRRFSEDQLNLLYLSPEGTLWVGGDDGRLAEVVLPSSLLEDGKYAFDCAQEQGRFSGPENVKPVVSKNSSDSPARELVTVKRSAALAENESDDDEWRQGLFSR